VIGFDEKAKQKRENSVVIKQFSAVITHSSPFVSVVKDNLLQILDIPPDLVQTPDAWWDSFKSLITEDPRAFEKFASLEPYDDIRKLLIIISAYFLGQIRRIRWKTNVDVSIGIVAARSLREIVEIEKSRPDGPDPLNIVEVLAHLLGIAGAVPDPVASLAAQKIEKYFHGSSEFPLEHWSTLLSKADFLFLAGTLRFCGCKIKPWKLRYDISKGEKPNSLDEACSLLAAQMNLVLLTKDVEEMPTDPVLRWLALAEAAADVPPENCRDMNALKAAAKYVENAYLSELIDGPIKESLGVD
jgi:hypothetical protein